MNKIKIYKLVYDDKIIYVGLTTLPLYRRKGSANYSVPKEIYKQSKIELIEETTEKNRERFWIEHYLSLGEPLLNKRNGDYSTKDEAYKDKLSKMREAYKLKSTFKPKSQDEKKAYRRKWYKDNKERLNQKRREKYKNGESWWHKQNK